MVELQHITFACNDSDHLAEFWSSVLEGNLRGLPASLDSEIARTPGASQLRRSFESGGSIWMSTGLVAISLRFSSRCCGVVTRDFSGYDVMKVLVNKGNFERTRVRGDHVRLK
jgi:hypothetical protein